VSVVSAVPPTAASQSQNTEQLTRRQRRRRRHTAARAAACESSEATAEPRTTSRATVRRRAAARAAASGQSVEGGSSRSRRRRLSRKRRKQRERQAEQTPQLIRRVPAGYRSSSESSSDPGSDGDESLLGDMSPSRFHAFEDLVAPLPVEALGPREPSSVPTAVPAEVTWSSGSSPSGVSLGWLGPGPGGVRPESEGIQTRVETTDQSVQAIPFTLNTHTQTTFDFSFSFEAETSDSAAQTGPIFERIEPHNTAAQAVQLVLANPSVGRGFLRRSLVRAFRETGSAQPSRTVCRAHCDGIRLHDGAELH